MYIFEAGDMGGEFGLGRQREPTKHAISLLFCGYSSYFHAFKEFLILLVGKRLLLLNIEKNGLMEINRFPVLYCANGLCTLYPVYVIAAIRYSVYLHVCQ